MEKTLTLKAGRREAFELAAGITRCIDEIDELRDEMRRDEEAIEESSQRTDAILSEISQALSELRAA